MTSKDLLALRHRLGMTQNELAFAIDIRRDSYKQFETGKRKVPKWLITRLEQIKLTQSQTLALFNLGDKLANSE